MPDCAFLLGVCASTIEKRIRAEYDQTFSEFRDEHLTNVRMRILEAQFEKAFKDKDTQMLKHLGEHFCGQVSKSQTLNLNATIGVEEYLKRLNEGPDAGQD
jgi:hypothetical protein